MASNEEALRRLLELSKLHADEDTQNEQRELVKQIASNIDVQLDSADNTPIVTPREEVASGSDEVEQVDPSTSSGFDSPSPVVKEAPKPKPAATKPVESPKQGGVSSARGVFEQDSKKVERKPVRKSMPPPKRDSSPSATAGGANECDLSDPKVVEAYEAVRDDNTDTNWLMLGYGGSKKDLQLYGSGEGALQEFVSKLPDNEVVYGYIRMTYGDSARSKFVFVTYVPESLSGLSKAKANMHKPSIDRFLKYFHVQVNATSHSDLQEAPIQAKLAAAAGANYGTGGQAPAGSENFGNIKNNARSFFSETEKKGSVSIKYNKDPLSATTPVSLMGRAGITEKYIST